LPAAADGVKFVPLHNLGNLGKPRGVVKFDFEPIGFYSHVNLVIGYRHFTVYIFPIDAKVQFFSKNATFFPLFFKYFFPWQKF
jgi:hypothetical protein